MAEYYVNSSDSVTINLTNNTDMIDLKFMVLPTLIVKSVNKASQNEENQTKIGNGEKIVYLRYDNFNFGPIYAKGEDEIKNIFVLFKDKVECRKYKKRLLKTCTKTEAALKARTSLPADIVTFIDHAFTKADNRRINKLNFQDLLKKNIKAKAAGEMQKLRQTEELQKKFLKAKAASEARKIRQTKPSENIEKTKAKNKNETKSSITTLETIENSTIGSNCDISAKGADIRIDFREILGITRCMGTS